MHELAIIVQKLMIHAVESGHYTLIPLFNGDIEPQEYAEKKKAELVNFLDATTKEMTRVNERLAKIPDVDNLGRASLEGKSSSLQIERDRLLSQVTAMEIVLQVIKFQNESMHKAIDELNDVRADR